jgi:ankyrin repeat protein
MDIFEATRNGNLERVQEHLNNGVDVNSEQFLRKETCLHIASFNGDYECVKLLLDRNANPNHQGSMGYTPLHCAIINNKIECAKLLLEHGTDPNIQIQITSFTGYIPCYSYKMISGLLGLSERLLSDRGYMQTEDYVIGFTALHFACLGGHEELITLLLSYNADLSIRDEYNRTPLDLANECLNLEYRGNRSAVKQILTDEDYNSTAIKDPGIE